MLVVDDDLAVARGTAHRLAPAGYVTANAMQGDGEKCLAAGMNDSISQPVRQSDLRAARERFGQPRGLRT